MNEKITDDIAISLGDIFANGFPECEAWRKTLSRIEKQFKDEPEMMDLLKRIGLCRRGIPRRP